jgi:hypothetical protein
LRRRAFAAMMPGMIVRHLIAAAAVVIMSAGSAQAAPQRFGGFVVYPDVRDVIALDSEINGNTIHDFKRAMAERPLARVVLLQSRGGRVDQALELAREIEKRGLSTAVPRGAGCYSACAYVFFAGRERVVEGRLGVHQISGQGTNQLDGTIRFFSEVRQDLMRFEVPEEVIKAMLKTRPEDIYVFTKEEIAEMAINRAAGPDSLAAKYAASRPQT